MPSDTRGFAKKRLMVMLVGGFAGVGVALAGIYGMGWLVRKSAVPEACRPAAQLAQTAPAARPRRSRGARSRQQPDPADGRRVPRRRRQGTQPRRLEGQDRAAQPVGHLVRALQEGNAGARRIAEKARRSGFRGGGGQHRHPQSGKGQGLADRYRDRGADLLRGQLGEDIPGAEGKRSRLRHADHDSDRPERLRGCDAGGSGGMGQRRRDQVHSRRRSASRQTEISRLPPMPAATSAFMFSCAASRT